jgi:hypothetical protein
MNKLSIPLCLLAAATLAACGNNPLRDERARASEVQAADTSYFVSPTQNPLRTGKGKIVTLLDPRGPVEGISWQRMTLRMEDGSEQIVDRQGRQVAWGENVHVRTDGTLRRDPYVSQAKP